MIDSVLPQTRQNCACVRFAAPHVSQNCGDESNMHPLSGANIQQL
jgi:hypothetical protein